MNRRFIRRIGYAPGIAVAHGHLYWTNPGAGIGRPGTIGRATLRGTEIERRFITGATGPVGVAVDDKHLYWVNDNDTIGRASINGSDVTQRFVRRTLALNSIAVDANGRRRHGGARH